MTGITEAYDWRNRTLVDQHGEKIGKVDEIYVDEQTRELEWARVTTGFFGTKHSFVPLSGAYPKGENVVVAATKQQVTGAPHYEAHGELSQQQEADLFRHYGIDYTAERSVTQSESHDDTGEAA